MKKSKKSKTIKFILYSSIHLLIMYFRHKKVNHQELPSKRMLFIMEPLPRFELGTLALQVNHLLLTLLLLST